MRITTKDQALQLALSVAPELHAKQIYKITDEKPPAGYAIPIDCWYIIYSSQDKHCANQLTSSRLLALSKDTGEVLFKGSLQDKG